MKNEPERIQHLWDLTNYALDSFRQLGFEIGNTSTPIIPLYIRDFLTGMRGMKKRLLLLKSL